jgi:hypothetical protein
MNTDTIMMKRCPSHEDNYELKPRPLLLQIKQDDEEKEKEEDEDEGKYTCSHGVEMSRRDTTICDTCYWDSRPTDEATNYNDSLLQKQVKDHEEGEEEYYDEIQSVKEECYNFDREIRYYIERFLLGRHECKEYEIICKRIAAYEEKYYTK